MLLKNYLQHPMNNLNEINRNIGEIKKKILLAEGQKTANASEWQKQIRINFETVATLKKEIKELTDQYAALKNPLLRSTNVKDSSLEEISIVASGGVVRKAQYPAGAKTANDAIHLSDLKVTDCRKQLDLLRYRYHCKRKLFGLLLEQYKELLAFKNYQEKEAGSNPPETAEENSNRKLVCQLENEIHRTNVQWMEAEHIRKKYCSIQSSLMSDAERFEKALKELEQALNDQRAEVKRLQDVHNESIEMRDAAKIVLQRQEQQANHSLKARERQALEYSKQVELRKLELERIGRKLFFDGKTFTHQDSIGSSSGEQNTAKTETDDGPNAQLENMTSNMESIFKNLMEVTGATSPIEVLERFRTQKESSVRLNYLRTAAEIEKSHLESQRDDLNKQLEISKFSDVKESEINQEIVDKIKTEIENLREEMVCNLKALKKVKTSSKFIEKELCEIIYKLQEADESDIILCEGKRTIRKENLPDFLNTEATNEDLISILQVKLDRGVVLGVENQKNLGIDLQKLAIADDELLESFENRPTTATPEAEKPQPMPPCYYNLISGKASRAVGTLSSSPEQLAPQAPTDDEGEVPSRNVIKRQSVLIIDTKSRRKPFRSIPVQRKK